MLTMKTCVIIGLVGSVLGCAIPKLLVQAFTSDADLIRIAVPATRFLIVMFPLIGFTITNSNFFQSIDKPWIAILTSLSRQIIFLVPFCYLFPLLMEMYGFDGLTGVWLGCTVSDVAGAALAAVLLYSQRKVFSMDYKPVFRVHKEAGPDDSSDR